MSRLALENVTIKEYNKVMSNTNKRQNLIQDYFLKHKTGKTSQILRYINESFRVDKRTIIRDLDVLCAENFIRKSGQGRNVHYNLSKSYQIFEPIDPQEYFSTPFDDRNINEKFNFEKFNLLTADVFSDSERQELQDLHQQFRKNFSKYDSQTIINREYERILIEFSWKSSQIEGNTYSLLNTEVLIKENKADETKTNEETQMILNHKDAFNEVLQNRNEFLTLSSQNLEYIHHTLTKNLGVTKNFRTLPVGITGTNYRPLDNIHQIKEAVESLITLINSKKDFFEKSFLSLLLLSYIQAFEDNSIPISYRAVSEVEYKKASIIFYEQNNLSYFKEIFIKQFRFAVEHYFR